MYNNIYKWNFKISTISTFKVQVDVHLLVHVYGILKFQRVQKIIFLVKCVIYILNTYVLLQHQQIVKPTRLYLDTFCVKERIIKHINMYSKTLLYV